MAEDQQAASGVSGLDAGNSAPKGERNAEQGETKQDETKVKSSTPENADGKINPSAPGDTGTTEKSRE